MQRTDLTPLQRWELCNICDCGEFEYGINEAKFPAITEMVQGGLLSIGPVPDNKNRRVFKPTLRGYLVAAAIEARR